MNGRVELGPDGDGYVILHGGVPIAWIATEAPQRDKLEDRLRDARDIAEKSETITGLQAHVVALAQDLESARREAGRLAAERSSAAAAVAAEKADRLQAELSLADVRAELADAHRQTAQARAEVDEVRTLLDEAREQVEVLGARLAQPLPDADDATRADVIHDVAYFLYTNGMTAAGDAVRRQWPRGDAS